MITHIDEVSANLYYIGSSFRGNADVDPVWDIKRITITGADVDVETAIADGSGNPINKGNFQWTERTNYTYG